MRRTGLSAYKIQFRDRYAREPWRLRRASAQDGYALVNQYLDSRNGQLMRLGDYIPDTDSYTDERAIKLVHVEQRPNRRMLAGLFLQGEAGLVQEIHDLDDPSDAPLFTTSRSQAALAPLYFRFHLEDGRNYGIALLQTFGKEGLKGSLQQDMQRFAAEGTHPVTVRLTQLVDSAILDQLAERGLLQDVTLINSGRTPTSRTAMERTTVGADSMGKEGDRLALRLHRPGGWPRRTLRRLVRAARGQGDPRDIVNAPGLQHIDEMFVAIVHNGRVQRFSLLNPDDSPIRLDITSDVSIGTNGFPTWKSVHGAAEDAWQQLSHIIA